MGWIDWVGVVLSFCLALVIGTLVEYVVHRLMHARIFLYKVHARHHQTGEGQGWLWEFKDYFVPSLPIAIGGLLIGYFFISLPVGIAFFAGCMFYASAAAYAHQVQHENPDLCFWLRRPVHHLHHNGKMWHHNFGILVDVWDRVFGTYKPVEYVPKKKLREYPLSAYFKIKWF